MMITIVSYRKPWNCDIFSDGYRFMKTSILLQRLSEPPDTTCPLWHSLYFNIQEDITRHTKHDGETGKSMLIISLLRLNCFGARLPSSIGSVQLQNNICKHFYTEGLHHPSSLHLFNSRQVLNIYSTLLSHPSDAVCVLQMFSSLVPPEILNPCVCFLCVCVCVCEWYQSNVGTDDFVFSWNWYVTLKKKKKKSHKCRLPDFLFVDDNASLARWHSTLNVTHHRVCNCD